MAKSPVDTGSRSNGVLSRFTGTPYTESKTIPTPGFEGSRPLLSFVLKVLAGHDPGLVRQEILLRLELASHQLPIGAQNPNPLEEVLADPHLIGVAEGALVAEMKRVADLWIDSGKAMDAGSIIDTPGSRNIQETPVGHEWPLHFYLTRGFLDDHVSRTALRRDGTRFVSGHAPSLDHARFAEIGRGPALQEFGSKTAMFWFIELLNSPYALHFSRCDECQRYFAYERAPKRPLVRGVYCLSRACRRRANAARAKCSTERLKRAHFETAAIAWDTWKPSRRRGSQVQWTLKEVNKRHGSDHKVNWLTRNRKSIDEEIARRKKRDSLFSAVVSNPISSETRR